MNVKKEIETLVVLEDLSQEISETSFDCHHLVLHLAVSTVQLLNQFSSCNSEQPGIEKLDNIFNFFLFLLNKETNNFYLAIPVVSPTKSVEESHATE